MTPENEKFINHINNMIDGRQKKWEEYKEFQRDADTDEMDTAYGTLAAAQFDQKYLLEEVRKKYIETHNVKIDQ